MRRLYFISKSYKLVDITMDEWDKIILGESGAPEGVTESVPALPDAMDSISAPADGNTRAGEKVVPLKPSELVSGAAVGAVSKPVPKPVSVDGVSSSTGILSGTAKTGEVSKKSPPPAGVISPYVSKLPALWGLDLAHKFATVALALTLSFGVYSFSVHISNLGFKKTLTGTADSVLVRAHGAGVIVASIFEAKNGESTSQVAVPFVAVEVLDAGDATTSEQLLQPGISGSAAGADLVNAPKFEEETNVPIW